MAGVRSQRSAEPKTLEDFLGLPYRLEISQGEFGAFVVRYPELQGCITQVENLEDAIPAAKEILTEWLELALEDNQEIPFPRTTGDYSGKFLIRISKSLHRELSESAEAEGVSLNAYVMELLASGRVWRESQRHFEEIHGSITMIARGMTSFQGIPYRPYHGDPLANIEYPVAA